jgi:hypothetical protein
MTAPERRRSWWSGLLAPRPGAVQEAPATVSDEEQNLKPSAMRGDEARWGYVVAGALIVVAIINLTVTHGPGAAKHPNTTLALAGLLASIILVPIIRTHHRFIVPLAAIGAAFFVTLPSQVPNSVRSVHIVALIIPVVYAFVLTQRQRRATTAQAQARRASSARTTATKGAATQQGAGARRAADRKPRRGRRSGAAQGGPAASRRYTPPKPKRPRRPPTSEPADQGRKWWGRASDT